MADFYRVEHRVNGFWNAYLNKKYQANPVAPVANSPFPPTFLIAPEAYPQPDDTSGFMADLLVSKLIYDGTTLDRIVTPHLVFEGKGSTGDTMEKARIQLEKWLVNAAIPNGQVCFAIAARGNNVSFWKWDPALSQKFLFNIKVTSHNVVTSQTVGSSIWTEYNITDGADNPNIVKIMDYIRREIGDP